LKSDEFLKYLHTTTKAGNDHFMNTLHDDLCWQGHNDYIKLTTVYPGAIATQKELQKLCDEISGMPMEDPSSVGRATVEGMLRNRRKFFIPPSIRTLLFLK
jgi:short-subunit dehydrogenase